MVSRTFFASLLAAPALFALTACAAGSRPSAEAPAPSSPAAAQLAAPDAGEWPSDGREYNAQRFSPLTQITAQNVSQLGLAWYADLDTFRGVEGTPLYADGVIYNIAPFNITTAYDAKTGAVLWTFDPKVPREWARVACCEPVARGLAMWGDKVIIATLDGRLIGLDRKTGTQIWSTRTFEDDGKTSYSITGAPRVFDGKVVVGQSGGDLGVRGFVAAWDADTGEKVWKFYLTPNDPAKGPDGEASDPIMDMIRATWSNTGQGRELWKELGGGGNAWDAIAYDPKLKLIYIGTGNGSPHSRWYRSNNQGDNLFLCSIVAVHAETGAYVWHYQMNPGEDWDYTCTSSMISAELTIDGRQRSVLMQAPKNGFFYVLDRATGEFISAKDFVKTNWTLGFDAKGRPIDNPAARYDFEPKLVMPGPGGGHNWFPMAFSPRTGLAYFPAYQSAFVYALQPDWKPQPRRSNSGWGGFAGEVGQRRAAMQAEGNKIEGAWLTAWDPVKQQEAWRVPLPRHGNGGVFVTASDLVFEGTTKQTFAAFDARSGKTLWEFPTQSAPVAGGITYLLDGVQYVAINAGWGGGAAQQEQSAGIELPRASARLLVFKLGGTKQLPPLAAQAPVQPPPPLRASEAVVAQGAQLYAQTCAVCHGQNAIGGVKDLRHMSAETRAKFSDIVLKGILVDKGMASFADLLNQDQVNAINAYLVARANEDWGR
jgi:quinohemoprotein ethanol dehydrogenase